MAWGSLKAIRHNRLLAMIAIWGSLKTIRETIIRIPDENCMKTPNCLTSACRYCRFYQPEGRRGGHCQQLGAPVRGSWKACSLAIPPFAPSWETLEAMMIWQQEMLVGQADKLAVDSFECSPGDASDGESVPTTATASVALLV